MTFPPETLATPRLTLRPVRLDDAAAVFAYASDPEVTRYLAFRRHQSPEDAVQFTRAAEAAWAKREGHLPWALVSRADGAVVGAFGADVAQGRVNVGYVLARPYWGRGYMTEVMVAVRDAAFADPSVWRFQAYHDVDNVASGRVMEKAGLRFEVVLRRYHVAPNVSEVPRDCVMRALVRDDLAG